MSQSALITRRSVTQFVHPQALQAFRSLMSASARAINVPGGIILEEGGGGGGGAGTEPRGWGVWGWMKSLGQPAIHHPSHKALC